MASIVSVLALAGCGKKGPPLPPLVKLPAAPAELMAERRGDTVDVQFSVPAANTDNSRPANVNRVDVYAITAPAGITDDQFVKNGTRVGSVAVKAPRDPNLTTDPDEPGDEVDSPEGAGLDQGARAHASETLTRATLQPADVAAERKRRDPPRDGPLVPSIGAGVRMYAAVGVSTRGKRGPLSKRASVPLVEPPPAPAAPEITYDEKSITVAWKPPVPSGPAASGAALLPSRPLGTAAGAIGYNVYDATQPDRVKLTRTPSADTKFSDSRITWGEKRCYVVRTAETVGDATVESDASPAECVTPIDRFAPAPPKNLTSAPGERAISLIWDANTESDLAGYLVFRAPLGSNDLRPLTPSPIQEPTFRDEVEAGAQFVYAVKAVDKAGNASDFSNRVQEAAR